MSSLAHPSGASPLSLPAAPLSAERGEPPSSPGSLGSLGRGARLGPFEVIRMLPPGGMADLLLVRLPAGAGPLPPERRDEPLVLKVVQPRFLESPTAVDLLRDEGRLGLRLRHRNLPRVWATGDLGGGGDPYIAMEYIPGRDLLSVLRRIAEVGRAWPRELGVFVAAEVARALACAHGLTDEAGRPAGVVHCDVSPGNIHISTSGRVVLLDFGVARPLAGAPRGQRVAGKHSYMAPEQIRGEPLDGRADVFSLGVILWEMTCGRRLFPGPAQQAMRLVLEGEIPPPRRFHREYPAELEAVVLRALARDPDQRYPSAAALARDLDALLAWRGAAPQRLGARPAVEDASVGRGGAERALARLLFQLFPHRELLRDAPLAPSTQSPPPRTRARLWALVLLALGLALTVAWLRVFA